MSHIHEKIDFTVEVFTVYQNKVLLRFHDKYNLWLGVGGHIELGEDPNEAAIREVKEEIGLDVRLADDLLKFEKSSSDWQELIPPKFLNRHRISENHEHITFIYFATSDTDKVNISDTEKNTDYKWLTAEELEQSQYDIKDDIIFYARQALKELGKK